MQGMINWSTRKIYVTRTPAGITPSCPLTEATVWVVLVAEAEAVSCPVSRVFRCFLYSS